MSDGGRSAPEAGSGSVSLERQLRALRGSAAWRRSPLVACLRVEGDGAWDLLDRLCPAELLLRDGQMRQTVLLDREGAVAADLLLACDDESFFLLIEGMTADGFAAHAAAHAPDLDGHAILDLAPTHELISIDGPFAWEALARLLGPEVVGLPYLTFFHQDGLTCFRAGKTGEFGYDILAPREEADALARRLAELAPRLDLEEASLAALDQCALENWFFNVRREGRLGLCPLELQLQWRLSRRKEFVGSAALAERRRRGVARRVTTVVSPDEIGVGDEVVLDGRPAGTLINAGRSPLLGGWVGLALLERGLAHAGLEGRTAAGAPLRTVAPPVLNNLSLFLSPQIHSYALRHEIEAPPPARQLP